MSTILTAAGESLIARLQAEGKPLVIDTMILANVPGQDHTQPIAPGVTVPVTIVGQHVVRGYDTAALDQRLTPLGYHVY